MRHPATATIVAAALLMMPGAALAASKTPTRSTATTIAGATTTYTTVATTTPTTPASIPTTTITTPRPGSSPGELVLAPARGVNLALGHTALTAYASYLQTLVAAEASSQANDATYVSTVETGCKSDLEPLTEGMDAVRPTVQDTLTLLGKEIGDDLAISYDLVAQSPLVKLAGTLDHLRWVHGGHNADVITDYLTAETTLLSLPQSMLCQNVLLAASDPGATPDGTHTFLTQYAQTAGAASSALGDFLVLLRTYATASDQPLLRRISALADEFATRSKADLLASGRQLSTSLETT